MEKIIVVAIVIACIGLLVWHLVRSFKGKSSCHDCGSSRKCNEDCDVRS
jgi:hypothetical protein